MGLIDHWTNISWTPDNTTSKLEEIYQQQHTLEFNDWIKLKQQSTGNVRTKPTVNGIKNEEGLIQWVLLPFGMIVIEQLKIQTLT